MAKQTTQKSALIVYAHQEPKSFNAALKDTAVDTLTKLGYTVHVSDLYAQGFDPRATKDDFTGPLANPDHLQYQNEIKHAYEHSTLNDEIKAEVNKLRRADLIIFQFPMYWFSVPAILKGWFDRVLIAGFAFAFPNNIFDNGLLKGKRAILSLTTSGSETMYSDRGISGDIRVTLWPIHYGTLRFCGFDVMQPQVSFSPGFSPESKRKEMLDNWSKRLEGLQKEAPQSFVSTDSFDPQKWFVMKDEFIEKEADNNIAPSVGHHLGKKLSSKK
ncbi:ribosyldihydronicotinamide dehydrogenase [quinone]-like [Argopecten irradians]|uniref:ribosyldihydronicotinamide dehydrogenase [quinone]-like n=1 Tax=Argopecten irradians TaxID=31199 RepID=UPI0037131DB5